MSIRSAANTARTTSARWWAAAMVMLFAPPPNPGDAEAGDTNQRRRPEWIASDRGDVPGWVMITVMTAIVVLALIVVFKGAVVEAVGNAFDKIVNYKD